MMNKYISKVVDQVVVEIWRTICQAIIKSVEIFPQSIIPV